MYFPGDVKLGHNIHVCSFYTHIEKLNNNSHTAKVQALAVAPNQEFSGVK